jgi:prevent-host-death family protein
MKGLSAMITTTTELRRNIGKYNLQLAETRDIIVTKHNKPTAKLTGIRERKLDILDNLVGIIEDDGYTLENARKDRLAKQ